MADEASNTGTPATSAAAPAAISSVTLTAGQQQPEQRQIVEQVQAPQPQPVDPADQVTVKAVRSFQGVEGFKNPESAPFSVSKQRAADLFANGLVEYPEPADEDAAIQAAADSQIANVKAAAQARRTKK
jgi:hypothetical protein